MRKLKITYLTKKNQRNTAFYTSSFTDFKTKIKNLFHQKIEAKGWDNDVIIASVYKDGDVWNYIMLNN